LPANSFSNKYKSELIITLNQKKTTPWKKKTTTKSLKKNTSIIDVRNILEVLEQNNFSNQKQVDLLQILNFALYKKQYPHDTCGIIEKKTLLSE